MKKYFYVMVSIALLVSIVFMSCERGTKEASKMDDSMSMKDDKDNMSSEMDIDYNALPENVEFTIVAAINTGLDSYNFKALMLLKNFIENASNGRLGLQVYPNGQIAATVDDGYRGLRDGTIDIFQVTGDAARYWPPISVFDIPYMLADDRIAEAVLTDTAFIETLRNGQLAKNPKIRLMMITNSGGWRNFATVKKQIKTPSDVQGVKLRTVASKVQQELVKLLGGVPTSIAWPEVYTSLSTGVVDGTKNGVVDIMTVKFDDVLNYITLDGHAYMAGFWMFSQTKYDMLPDDLQVVLNDGFSAMQQYLFSYPKYQSIEAFRRFRARGIEIYKPTPDEIKEFQKETQPIQDWFVNEYAKDHPEIQEYLDLYKATIAKQTAMVEATRNREKN